MIYTKRRRNGATAYGYAIAVLAFTLQGAYGCRGHTRAISIFFIGVVYPGALFIGDNGAFLCTPMKIVAKFRALEGRTGVLVRGDLRVVRRVQHQHRRA